MKKILLLIFILFIIGCIFLSIRIFIFNDDQDQYTHQKNTTKKNISKQKEQSTQKTVNNIDDYLNSTHFNGNITVYKNGQRIMSKAYGYRNFELSISNDKQSMYLLGSANKFVTGMILKQLEEEGKVHLDENVNHYIPNFNTQQQYPITVRDLVLHNSGLAKYKVNSYSHGLDSAIDDIKLHGIIPSNYHVYNYNDANYIIIAKIIENVTHQSFQKNLEKYIIHKLNLKHTSLFNSSEHQPFFVKGYEQRDNHLIFTPTKSLDKFFGAGNIYTSTDDMAKIVLNFKNGQLLNQISTQNLLAPAEFGLYPSYYRYGFYNYPKHQRYRGIFFNTDFITYSNDQYIVSIASNQLIRPYNEQLESSTKHIFTKILNQKLS